jgi:hypothetical protein
VDTAFKYSWNGVSCEPLKQSAAKPLKMSKTMPHLVCLSSSTPKLRPAVFLPLTASA